MEILLPLIFLIFCLPLVVCATGTKSGGTAGKTKPSIISGNKKTGSKSKANGDSKSSHTSTIIGDSTEGKIPPAGYDATESGLHDDPLTVNLTIWIESIMAVDMTAMEVTLHAYVIQQWLDARLANIRNHSVVVRDRSQIYLTDLYCVNCKQSGLNSNANEFLLRVNPDGHVYYSQSSTLSPSCLMDLRDFPFDQHNCNLILASYGQNISHISLNWGSEIILTETKLQQFSVSGKANRYTNVQQYISGNYTQMKAEISITREQGFYILQVFIPCFILVILSWIIYYMAPDQVGDRLAIGVTLILTMIFLLGYANGSLPKVSYIKAIDWYMIFCLFCISSSLIETVFVYWQHNACKQKEKNEEMEKKRRQMMESGRKTVGFRNEGDDLSMVELHSLLNGVQQNGSNDNNGGVTTINLQVSHDSNDNCYHSQYNLNATPRARSKFNFNNLKRRMTKPGDSLTQNSHSSRGDSDEGFEEQGKHSTAFKIDKVFRLLFPLLFTAFNVFYFIEYFHHRKKIMNA